MPQINVFIPHHSNRKHLIPLFSSLLNMGLSSDQAEFILVDNGSADGSVDLVRRKFPLVKIHRFERNQGFAPALNQAVRAYDSEWACFLNNDVWVDPDWLPNLLFAAEKTKSPCAASHILDWTGKKTQFAGGWINLFGKGFESSDILSREPYEIFFPCGGAMLIRRDVFLEAGGFDDEYFMLYEDVDLGWRLRLFGHKIYLAPDAWVMHRGHASLKNEPYSRKAVFYERNSLATIYKNLSDASLCIAMPLALREAELRAHALGGAGSPFRYSSDGLAMREALADFFRLLPHWKEKHAFVQSRRKCSDEEIFKRFFPQPTQMWAYAEQHYRRIAWPQTFSQIWDIFQKASEELGLIPSDEETA
ncbi:MAG: glycosyltransferase family 2 protein [Candidatus Omnitrophota bacterium]